MSLMLKEDQLSDEEIFFGKLSMKEIKKHILWNNHPSYTCSSTKRAADYDDVKIIETHSAPNLNHRETVETSVKKPASCSSLSPNVPEVYNDWELKPVDDSFLKVEQMVADLCVSPKEKKVVKKEELNNTLDIIDYILNKGPPSQINVNNTDNEENQGKNGNIENPVPNIEISMSNRNPSTPKHVSEDLKLKVEKHFSPAYFTPAKSVKVSQRQDMFGTPSSELKPKTPIFKTPANPLSSKKSSATSLKKTPMKNNAYQHIASPVASYIKNCPVAPLVKEVRPSKPLPGTSSIPKFVKSTAPQKPSNKENINLPPVAYKSAKKIQVIDMPDEEKLPQTQLMKKITSSLPKPLIMKHNHREINMAKRILGSRQEDSFADLSLQQADVSVCTQKSAFNKPKKAL